MMMHLPDGTIGMVFSNEGFAKMVRDLIGYEAEQYVLQLIADGDKAKHLAESDFRSYELQVEAMYQAMIEISELIEQCHKKPAHKTLLAIQHIIKEHI